MMKKIKVTFPFPTWPISRQMPGNKLLWGNYEFYINSDIQDCDYWFVFNSLLKPEEQAVCAPENTVFIAAEPWSVMKYNPSFLRQFTHIITCQREIKHPNKYYLPQAHPWFIEKSFDELMAEQYIKKTKKISIITSNKQMTDGHKRRFDFTMKLKDYLGDQIDLFGRGINDFDQKLDVLEPYQYSIAIENYKCADYFTEKVFDCFLTHTFPFYDGCPNISYYFPQNCFQQIDILNFNRSLKVIEQVLNDKEHYNNHLQHLVEAKKYYLNNYNLFPFIIHFIKSSLSKESLSKEEIQLVQKHFNFSFLTKQLVRKICPGLSI